MVPRYKLYIFYGRQNLYCNHLIHFYDDEKKRENYLKELKENKLYHGAYYTIFYDPQKCLLYYFKHLIL